MIQLVLLLSMVAATAGLYAQPLTPTPLPRAAVLQLVQQRNITVEQATLRQEQARMLKGASVDLGPTSIVWSGGQYNAPDFDNSFSIEQSVPFPTRLAAAHGQAEAAEAVAAIEKSLAVRSVTATAEGIMDRIAYQRGILRILDQQDTLMQRAAVIAKRSFDAGQSPSVALLTAETNASEASMQRLQAEADLVKAELELRVLCRDSAVTVLDSTLVRQPAYVQATLAKEFRVAAERRQQLAAEQYDYAATEWWPYLTLAYTNQSLTGTLLPSGRESIGSDRFEFATVGISLPLWFPATSSRIEASQVEQQIIARTEQAELLALDRRINMLEQEFRVLQRAMDYYDGPSATRIATLIDHADRSYDAGDISWSEYQEAMETALDVQRRRLDVLLRYNEVVIELRQLTMN
ncbi:MAG: TolC family protein [Candidatus Kapaibacteriota bacterium]